jgi:hypothetical protein
LKGIGFGLVVQVEWVGDQCIPLLWHILRAEEAKMSLGAQPAAPLKRQVLGVVAWGLGEQEILVQDTVASIADMQAAGVPRYVVRMALSLLIWVFLDLVYPCLLVLGTNLTARPGCLPARCKRYEYYLS